jgi:hypothetical protein
MKASLAVTGAILLFFIVAPVFGYPLEASEARRFIQLVLPVFVGYLGSATYFVFGATGVADAPPLSGGMAASTYLSLLIRGPVVIWAIVSAAAVLAFGFANRLDASPGSFKMSVDDLSYLFTATLSLLTATTGVAVAYLFGRAPATQPERLDAQPRHGGSEHPDNG